MSAAGNFVSHTNGTRTIDGATGKNNRMERGGSVVSNPIWEPAAPNSPKHRHSRTRRDSVSIARSTLTRLVATAKFLDGRHRSISMGMQDRLSLRSHSLISLGTTLRRTPSARNCGDPPSGGVL